MAVQKTKVTLSKQAHNWLVFILLFVLLSFLLRFRGVADSVAGIIEPDPVKRKKLSKDISEFSDVVFAGSMAVAVSLLAAKTIAIPVVNVLMVVLAIAAWSYAFFEWKDFRNSSSVGGAL
ncbi:MAG: hypothetical protein RLO17_14645 [Cyclobacteriaceae bacterium]